jgi:1,4-dihydroxy-6-naphthoate synthase
MQIIEFGMSPCPNDTFAFHALAHGIVDAPGVVQPVMEDIEQLNQLAHTARLPFTKLSIGALAKLRSRYEPLTAGAALGFGVGPLVVARRSSSFEDVARMRVAIPGADTTAFLLLQLALGAAPDNVVAMRYDHILDAVAAGEVDAGLIIHESRFTYAERGLVSVADLGAWWEQQTSLPVPLAVICARTDVSRQMRNDMEQAVRASVEHAFANPDASREFIRAHAQEMSADVCARHIDLYVNEYSIDLGAHGMAAVNALLDAAQESSAE